MGAVPKTKVSRHRRGNRRQHQRIELPALILCPQCGKLMRSHRVCKNCGMYRNRQVLRMDEPTTEE